MKEKKYNLKPSNSGQPNTLELNLNSCFNISSRLTALSIFVSAFHSSNMNLNPVDPLLVQTAAHQWLANNGPSVSAQRHLADGRNYILELEEELASVSAHTYVNTHTTRSWNCNMKYYTISFWRLICCEVTRWDNYTCKSTCVSLHTPHIIHSH